MAEKEYSTIKEEMKALAIEPACFDTFYQRLTKQGKLPPVYIIPWQQYKTIVDYLREKGILGEEGNKLQRDASRLFDSKRHIEQMVEEALREAGRTRMGSSGGVAPCRRQDDLMGSGGIAPCRAEDDD